MGQTPQSLDMQADVVSAVTVCEDGCAVLHNKRLIVSLTTFPKRIDTVHEVLESIYQQTRPADMVVLWLADSQFPGREADLPQTLLSLIEEGKLVLRWCRDLRPHKKYFYAMQEFPDDLIVTIDDDLFYAPDMLEVLYKSYLANPHAVSATRVHLILIDEDGRILPYADWIKEANCCIKEPSMQLFATSGAGTLFPPHLFRREFFDESAVEENCLLADDLWLKAMQLVSDVPVVLADRFKQLYYQPSAKVEPLNQVNVNGGHNDVQLKNISNWLDKTFEPGILKKKLTETDVGVRLIGIEAVCTRIGAERKQLKTDLSKEKELTDRLDRERRALKEELANERQKYERLADRLDRERRALGEELANERQKYERLASGLVIKSRRYRLLAWLPHKLFRGIQCLDEHGVTYTIKLGVQKVAGKIAHR